MNSIEPPGSALMSQIASKRCGSAGDPILWINNYFRINKNE